MVTLSSVVVKCLSTIVVFSVSNLPFAVSRRVCVPLSLLSTVISPRTISPTLSSISLIALSTCFWVSSVAVKLACVLTLVVLLETV